MFLGGLWHGAAWSYAIWGTFHGCALAIERFFTDKVTLPQNRLMTCLRVLIVFAFVTFAWLLFKLPNFQDVIRYLAAVVNNRAITRYVIVAAVISYSLPV